MVSLFSRKITLYRYEKGAVVLFIQFTKQQKDSMITEIQRFFYEERDEEIGLIAAENAYEFFKNQLGPHFYNEAIRDARKIMEQRNAAMEEDLFSLEKKLK
ncbi:hypothetical protein BACCIP111895_01392 [Neobacillus rhizosphaerae]|uniref:DUF2164 domain-containing protein n=1 Tax=Neobacillus rhizosphaerae TaxID=2880965 RepID=A0ABM9ENM2_9BACI|nr:DUF2164 domain-containing protein [Neobacillus rhizosphaerae]CAH2714231.1 hypothetical protein BACCIP111895_01392 [Neobacillus rhizosphaerae]